ncbi:hypothetical protein BJP25_23755 [Actinokineospora bangkokensis]|uniref:Response regulatory domain-containing protein n=1 Tax=Actinokineospora bangkokensis TaxID=1193682 RepID=A0A1Q9LIN1_9PSEU|nr:hypothetical protein BJP25_23755 [Actinokineospora bangkokensis]
MAILGPPTVLLPDGERTALRKLNADLLVALALAGPAGRTKAWLHEAIWGPQESNHVAKAVSRLRRIVDVASPPAGGPYVLKVDVAEIDAWAFRSGVDELTAGSAVEEVDALLGMWRGNPADNQLAIRAGAWVEVMSARNRLVDHVLGMTSGARAGLTRWAAFCEVFHRESGRWSGASAARPDRKRVLVVDDLIGQSVALVLGARYDCHVVESIAQWNTMVREQHPLDFACALVDRHLTDGMADAYGEAVVRDLRALRPGMPIAFMSAGLPHGDLDNIKLRLGVDSVIIKANDEHGPLTDLLDTVDRLTR